MPIGNSTSQVSLQLTGTSTVPNNFTVDIYSWDVPTDAAVFNRTYITGLTRSMISPSNGGTLLTGYEITGITGTDRYVKLTSTTCVNDSGLISIEAAALTVYIPVNGSIYSAPGGAQDGFVLSNPPSGTSLAPGNHIIATFDSLSYLSASDFTATYFGGTYVSGGGDVTGTFVNGPFSSYSVNKSGKTFNVVGSVNSSLVGQLVEIHGIIKLTYTPSGKSTNFDYYYSPTSL